MPVRIGDGRVRNAGSPRGNREGDTEVADDEIGAQGRQKGFVFFRKTFEAFEIEYGPALGQAVDEAGLAGGG